MQKIARFIATAALFLVPLFPLIVANSYFFPFITGKAFFFRILIEVGFAAWLILCMYDAKYRPKVTPLLIGVTVFTVIALVADLLGVNPIRSLWSNFERMEGWMTLVHLWAFFVLAEGMFGSGEEGKRNWTRWLMAEVGVAFVVSIYGLLQLGGALAIHQGSTRIDASIGNAAYMAVYMLMNVGFIAYLYCARKVRLLSFKIRSNDLTVFWLAVASALLLVAIFVGGDVHASFWPALGAFASAHTWLFIIDLALIVLVVLYPLQLLPLLFAYELFQTATRGTILGLVIGVIAALLSYILFARGVNYKKILSVFAFVVCVGVTTFLMPFSDIWVLLVFYVLLAIFLVYDNKKVSESRVRRNRWINFSIVGAICLIVVTFFLIKGHPVIQNNLVLQRMASISWSEAQGQARNYLWPMALRGVADRPILGWGQENFNYIFNSKYDPRMYGQEQWFDRAHSVFIDWLVASGILGFLAYVSLYVIGIRVIWKSDHTVAEKSILTSLIVGYAIHNIFVFDNLTSYVLFFAALAFVNSFRQGRPIPWLGTAPVGRDTILFVGTPVVVIALALVLWGFQIRPIQANTRLITALTDCYRPTASVKVWDSALAVNTYVANQEIREQLLNCADRIIDSTQVSAQTKQDFFTLGAQAIRDQINATKFGDARTYTLGGSFFNVISQYSAALPLLERAHDLSPAKQSINMELATDYINARTPEKAIALLEADYAAVPANERVKATLALSYIAANRTPDAVKLYGGDMAKLETINFAEAYIISGQFQKGIAIYKKLYAADKGNIDLAVTLARLLYTTGDKAGAVSVFRQLQVAHPEYKDEIEKAIQETQVAL